MQPLDIIVIIIGISYDHAYSETFCKGSQTGQMLWYLL